MRTGLVHPGSTSPPSQAPGFGIPGRCLGASIIRTCLFLLVGDGVAYPAASAEGRSDGLVPDGVRDAPLAPVPSRPPGFTLLRPEVTGLDFANRLGEAESAANRVLENGSGVALGDFDGDGRCDVFLAGLGGNSALFRNLGGLRFTNVTRSAGLNLEGETARGAVFADLDGDRRPELLVSTLAAGVRCFRNEGGRGFREFTAEAGTGGKPGSTTLALADVDGDGTVDLYVTRYRAEDIRDSSNVEARSVGGRTELHPRYAGRLFIGPQGLLEYGEHDLLFLNDGRGRFKEVSWTGGAFLDEGGRPLTAPPKDWGLTASFRDVDGDGHPDLYVCNDYWTPDRFWLGNGRGVFRAAPADWIRHGSENSMGVDFADVDRDGRLDFLVLDMLSRDVRLRRRQALARSPSMNFPDGVQRPQFMRNSLFRQRDDGSFAEVADFAGLAASDWSWQPLFLDVDLDGWEDVVIPAGHRRDVQDLDATDRVRALQHAWPAGMKPEDRQRAFTRELMEHSRLYPPLEMPVVAFRNRGGLRFEEVTREWGLDLPAVHQGIAAGDLDGDGDPDLVVNRLNAPAALFRNEAAAPRLAVRLRGLPPNTEGIGARVGLTSGPREAGIGGDDVRSPESGSPQSESASSSRRGGAAASAARMAPQFREMVSGGRYLSGGEPILFFATGDTDSELVLEVVWRSGRTSRVTGVRAGRFYEIDEAGSTEGPPAGRRPEEPDPWFEDATARLGHRHHENAFDDLALQPLLPRRLSALGPGVAWFDVNDDGWDDLLIGTGAGGRFGAYTNDGRGGFRRDPALLGEAVEPRDQSGILGFRDLRGRVRILTAHGRYEGGGPAPAIRDRRAGMPESGAAIPDDAGSVGPLALGDVDGDGDLDLFVGGRVVPGRYPEAAPSRILIQEPEGWRPDVRNGRLLQDLGLVSGAVWGDLDGDADPDLALACEWGPVRVFRNDGGTLVETTREWGFEPFSGWWNGITLGDLDGDGQLDVVATNWGWNGPYTVSAERPAILLAGDFMGRGVVDVLETEWDSARDVWVPRRRLDELEAALPTLRRAFPTHLAFGEAVATGIPRALAADAVGAVVRRWEARTLASTVFYRRDGRFEAVELPPEAQWAPAFGVSVADVDGDGREDLLLSQNCHGLHPHQAPQDAGTGLVLRGRGDRRWEVETVKRSGIHVVGEQRGAAVADFDGDGRVDWVVTRNGGETRLFRNRRGEPGVRVRLQGPAGNPTGVGAVVRIGSADATRWGPARAVTAGSGYWSQESPVQVMARFGTNDIVRVRWPDGRRSDRRIPDGAREVTISHPAGSGAVGPGAPP